MTTAVTRPRHRRGAKTDGKANLRPDIQGLRMVAVILVVLSHLFHWPRGGFIGVDVFFVISGFLITGSLLNSYDRTGRISFVDFYRRRIKRIIPAATLALAATCLASYYIFTENRFKTTVFDAISAFFFVSNWRFGQQGTDYFEADGPVSALQHYWSLSVEEQFYFVWPVVILAIAAAVARRSGSRMTRLWVSAIVMGIVVAGSFAYSIAASSANPTWAYFSTLTRVWELGVGALLAITIGYFQRLPNPIRPVISWAGLGLIIFGAFYISESGDGFPAPWAALPVLGSALVIAAGTGGTHEYLTPLTNRVSTYIGDISYSLYLWHWPVIVLLGVIVDRNIYYYTGSILLMMGLSIAAYHFFEDPIRKSGWLAGGGTSHKPRKAPYRLPSLSSHKRDICLGTIALITLGASVIAISPSAPVAVPPLTGVASTLSFGAATTPTPGNNSADSSLTQESLTAQILQSLQTTKWPILQPTMEDAIAGNQVPADIKPCGEINRPDQAKCTWGSSTAPNRLVLIGDSTAMGYASLFKKFAENSGGQWQVRVDAMFGCRATDLKFKGVNEQIDAACPKRQADSVAALNADRPDLVVITNAYAYPEEGDWATGLRRFVSQFQSSVGKILFLTPPPADIKIGDCYNRLSNPTECISKITDTHSQLAAKDREVAHSIGGEYLDSTDWFCSSGLCPSFVGTVPMKKDKYHITPKYAEYIYPVFEQKLRSVNPPAG
ncbi:acyltransferase family protein [Rhodococcus hoagii]|nr:acyltransferase family protein [Prescottella equi]